MSATLSRVNLYEALTNAARVSDKTGALAAAKFARIEANAADARADDHHLQWPDGHRVHPGRRRGRRHAGLR